jgi:hypothetical protein
VEAVVEITTLTHQEPAVQEAEAPEEILPLLELQTPVAVAVAAWQLVHKQTVEPVVLALQ